ncbi:MAG: type II secretion system GspH family protein [Blastocatellia bacterium]|nr:type II secretion system GspH family protein [Blastocatellia bacterium]MCS7157617.1 type II secretion system GspH family protein [Blastocatellia bacterium]MCX7751882.1 type II secretion system GspH family protein [Blastocatellia bacterium]MDW8166988.1 type II secretion system protein [Acidobacteriota bacterium]MDW8257092.1 type II secretion system protein [Acidobacteriota bacterium]
MRASASARGYALLALIAAMTVMAILIAGYVPHLVRQMQREREEEMLFRGQQIVEAIAQYVQMTGRYPSSLEELVRGFVIQTPRGMRRVRFLRPSALIDPMTNEEWKVVRPGDPVLRRFVEAYLETVGQSANPMLLQFLQPGAVIMLPGRPRSVPTQPVRPGRRTRMPTPRTVAPDATEGLAESTLTSPSAVQEGGGAGPILGVVSKSEKKSVRVYYGLDRYSDWPFVFIPVLPVAVGEARVRAVMNPVMFPSDPLARLLQGGVVGPRRVVPQQRPTIQPEALRR